MENLLSKRVLIGEIDLFGRHFVAKDFLRWLSRQSRKKQEKFVRGVLDYYGLNSSEFYFVIQVLVVVLLARYNCFDEDTYQNCMVKVFDVVRHFDPSKGGIVSFIHCIVRDRVTLYRHYRKKHNRTVSLESVDAFADDADECVSFTSFNSTDDLVDFSSVLRLNRDVCDLGRMIDSDTIYRRVWSWRNMMRL